MLLPVNAMDGEVVELWTAQALKNLIKAALSFLGFGVQAPTPSWGLMLNEGREYMFFSPWLLALPGTGLFLLVLAINLFGDGLRDVTLERER